MGIFDIFKRKKKPEEPKEEKEIEEEELVTRMQPQPDAEYTCDLCGYDIPKGLQRIFKQNNQKKHFHKKCLRKIRKHPERYGATNRYV